MLPRRSVFIPTLAALLLHGLNAITYAADLVAFGERVRNTLGDGYLGYVTSAEQVAADVVAVSCGSDHTLFIKTDATLWACGRNEDGQLGDGTYLHRTTPAQVASSVKAVACGNTFSVFIKTDGTLWSVGTNIANRTDAKGNTPETTSSPIQIDSDVVSVTCGWNHILYLKTNGDLYGAGYSGYGQLGLGISATTPPTFIRSGVSAVAANCYHSLFITEDGHLYGMGQNTSGQLGNGTTTNQGTPILIDTDVAAAAAGNMHSLYIKTDGRLFAMGANSYGALGDGSTTSRTTPVQAATNAARCSAGGHFSIFTTDTGALYAMGLNADGELCNASIAPKTIPTATTLDGVAKTETSITAGWNHIAALKTDGTLWVCGSNEYGELGNGEMACTPTPALIGTGVAKAAGSVERTLIRLHNNSLWETGFAARTYPNSRRQVSADVTSMSVALNHLLFVTADGTLFAKGDNTYGQFGNGTTTSSSAAIAVGINGVKAVTTGWNFSLFIDQSNQLWGMGQNTYGQLGDGTTTNRSSPVLIASDVAEVSAGLRHIIFRKFDNTLWGCGQNIYYQLGPPSTLTVSTPKPIDSGVASITAGRLFTAYAKTDGTCWATGFNLYGQIGIGYCPEFVVREPTMIPVSADVVEVAAGNDHLLIRHANGDVCATGRNFRGQLGDGAFTNRTSPIRIATGAVRIGAGEHQTYILLDRDAPVIEEQPTDLVARSGQSAEMHISATAESPLTYQWYFGESGNTSTPVETANKAQLEVLGRTTGSSYWVRVSGFGGSTDSDTVTITPPATANEWAHAFGLADEASGPEQDPDGDGLKNLCEYALGTSPTVPDPNPLSVSADTVLRLVHHHNLTAAVHITYEVSNDLKTWTGVTPAITGIDADPEGTGEVELIEAAFTIEPGTPRQFLRIHVSSR